MKTLGIIGGLGPETGCKFYMNINNRFRNIKKCQPNLLLENVPISEKAERKIIAGNLGEEHEHLLNQSIRRMNDAKVNLVVIPCNTVHVFLEGLRKKSKVPILSIIDETVKECVKTKIKRVGLLGSSKTVKEKLYENALQKKGIKVIIPREQSQSHINQIIIRILHNQSTSKDKEFLQEIIKEMEGKGAKSIILGCTDLPLLINPQDINIPLISTLECLEDATLKKLLEL